MGFNWNRSSDNYGDRLPEKREGKVGTPEDVGAEKHFTPPEDDRCPECFGQTILLMGKGKNMSYRICSRYQESGHKTQDEIERILHQVRMSVNPSGRFA